MARSQSDSEPVGQHKSTQVEVASFLADVRRGKQRRNRRRLCRQAAFAAAAVRSMGNQVNGVREPTADMSASYAVVRLAARRVMSLRKPGGSGCKVPVFSTVQISVPSTQAQENHWLGKGPRCRIGKWWIEHADRRQYDAVVYAPQARRHQLQSVDWLL